MAAVGVKGLIVNFSEGIAPYPIGSYWKVAGAPQPLQRPSPNLNPQSVLRRFAPPGSHAWLGIFGVGLCSGCLWSPRRPGEDECWSELFQTMPVGGKFWFRFAWILLKMHEMWSFDSQENHENCYHQMSHFYAKMHEIPHPHPPSQPLGRK